MITRFEQRHVPRSKCVAMLCVLVLLIAALAPPVQAQLAETQKTRRQIASGKIHELNKTVRGGDRKASRMGKTPEGYLRFFGSPEAGRAMVAEDLLLRSPEEQARGFVLDHAEAFGVTSPDMDFEIYKVRTKGDRIYVRMRQTYAGLPVFCAETIVQLDKAGGVYAVFSDIMRDASRFEDETATVVPTLAEAEAERLALQEGEMLLDQMFEAQRKQLKNLLDEGAVSREVYEESENLRSNVQVQVIEGPELLVYDPKVVGNTGDPILAWSMTISTDTVSLLSRQVLVDAHTGELALSYSLIYEAKNRRVYNAPLWPLPLPVSTLTESTYPFTSEDDWNYIFMNRNFEVFGSAYDYYYAHHDRADGQPYDSYDGFGATINSNMYVISMPLYTGEPVNASYNPVLDCFLFSVIGWGLDVADDIIGHEFTHAVTVNNSDLIYLNEAGAIHESLSDIWGEFIDWSDQGWDFDWSGDRWLLGETTISGASRNMEDPPNPPNPDLPGSYRQPAIYQGDYWYSGIEDNGGVHINSGVGNKLAFLLTDGQAFNGHYVYGMGEAKVRQLFWECQTNLLSRGADYSYLYDALTQAALNLPAVFSANDRANIEQACQAVGISTSLPAFIIRDAQGINAFEFQSDGDLLLLKGGKVFDYYDGVRTAHLAPTSALEVIIRKGPNDSDVVARFDSETGNLYLRGSKNENAEQAFQRASVLEFLIQKPSGEVVSSLDTFGSLWIEGRFTHDDTLQLEDFF